MNLIDFPISLTHYVWCFRAVRPCTLTSVHPPSCLAPRQHGRIGVAISRRTGLFVIKSHSNLSFVTHLSCTLICASSRMPKNCVTNQFQRAADPRWLRRRPNVSPKWNRKPWFIAIDCQSDSGQLSATLARAICFAFRFHARSAKLAHFREALMTYSCPYAGRLGTRPRVQW